MKKTDPLCVCTSLCILVSLGAVLSEDVGAYVS